MKLAVLSDIHGNLPALEVVLEDILRWQPDQIIVNGDVVNRGAYSREAMELLTQQLPQAHYLKGNHEEFVLSTVHDVPLPDHTDYELRRMAHWTAEQLGDKWIGVIEKWANGLDLDHLGCGQVHATHASRNGTRDGIFAGLDDAELPDKLGPPTDLFITAHTHKPGIRHFNGTQIFNPGSVGAPLDHDPRASYGRLTYQAGVWHGEHIRLTFDRERNERDLKESGFIEHCGAIAQLVVLEFQQSRSHVGPWMRRYHHAVTAGDISVEAAVNQYQQDL